MRRARIRTGSGGGHARFLAQSCANYVHYLRCGRRSTKLVSSSWARPLAILERTGTKDGPWRRELGDTGAAIDPRREAPGRCPPGASPHESGSAAWGKSSLPTSRVTEGVRARSRQGSA
jgi:hypothetical protein